MDAGLDGVVSRVVFPELELENIEVEKKVAFFLRILHHYGHRPRKWLMIRAHVEPADGEGGIEFAQQNTGKLENFLT